MKYVFLFSLMLGLCLLFSCSRSNGSIGIRKAFAIQFNQERLAATKSVVESNWCNHILSSLASVDTKAANKLQLASAILAKGKSGNYGLFAFWIEDYPSVDGVEFQFSSKSTPVVLLIPQAELKQNQSEAKETIVFGMEYDWEQTSELCKLLDQIAGGKGLKIRLLRVNKPVTDWYPIDFYKVDRWIQ